MDRKKADYVSVRVLDEKYYQLEESIRERSDNLIVSQLMESEYNSDEQWLLAKEILRRLKAVREVNDASKE